MLTSQSKKLLKNSLKHIDVHNKVWEERICWKQRELEKRAEVKSERRKEKDEKSAKRKMPNSPSPSDSYSSSSSESSDSPQCINNDDRNYWTKRLYEFEASDKDRWGHSGYRDLYPEVFKDKDQQQIAQTSTEETSQRFISGAPVRVDYLDKKESRSNKRKRLESPSSSKKRKRTKRKRSKSKKHKIINNV